MKALFLTVLLLPLFAIAQEAAAPVIPLIPGWLETLLSFVAMVPAVGPYLSDIVKYAGIIAGVLTAVSTALIAIQKSLEPLAAKLDADGKLKAGLDAITGLLAKALPYIQYFSMYNVQKK